MQKLKTAGSNVLNFFSCESGSPAEITKGFIHSLTSIKGGLVVFLIAISIFYLALYRGERSAYTLLFNWRGKFRVIGDSLVTSLFGVLSVMYVNYSRGKAVFSAGALRVYLMVAGLLSLFAFAQEASGLNRWLARPEIQKREGIYYQIDTDNGVEAHQERLQTLESGGDPFITSASWLMFLLVAFGVFKEIIKMFKYTACGMLSGAFGLGKNNVSLGGFGLELLVILLLNAAPPLLFSPVIRGEGVKVPSAVSISTPFLGVILQVMAQYTGLLA